MAIADRTRKILWCRSGNRSAFCRRELVEDGTVLSDESVVGDEAHIIGEKPAARGQFGIGRTDLDEHDNLLLLCKVHHKLVDDQPETYTVEGLHEMKDSHERWVRVRLSADGEASGPKSDTPTVAALGDLQRRFVDAQERFPREVSFAMVMIPHDERQALKEAHQWFDDLRGPPRRDGWKCLATAGGGDTPETISIPASERTDGGECPLHCGMIADGHHVQGKRGEYQHLLRWACWRSTGSHAAGAARPTAGITPPWRASLPL
jgi:hypothetical protein